MSYLTFCCTRCNYQLTMPEDQARAYVCRCTGLEVPPQPFRVSPNMLATHEGGKVYRIFGWATWNPQKGWRVTVRGMRDGLPYGPLRVLSLASLTPIKDSTQP